MRSVMVADRTDSGGGRVCSRFARPGSAPRSDRGPGPCDATTRARGLEACSPDASSARSRELVRGVGVRTAVAPAGRDLGATVSIIPFPFPRTRGSSKVAVGRPSRENDGLMTQDPARIFAKCAACSKKMRAALVHHHRAPTTASVSSNIHLPSPSDALAQGSRGWGTTTPPSCSRSSRRSSPPTRPPPTPRSSRRSTSSASSSAPRARRPSARASMPPTTGPPLSSPARPTARMHPAAPSARATPFRRARRAPPVAPPAPRPPRRVSRRREAPLDARFRILGRHGRAQRRTPRGRVRRQRLVHPARVPLPRGREPRELRALDRGPPRAVAPRGVGLGDEGPGDPRPRVGVGANCVYPLIGAARNGWSFVGTDVTDAALEAARRNADANPRLAPLIEIRDARIRGESEANLPRAEEGDPAPIFARVRADEDRDAERDHLDAARDAAASSSSTTKTKKKIETRGFAFTMCNPPFFESEADAKGNAGTDFGGVASEMACAGGELAFVSRILAESSASADARRFAHWYTTMCGKKETVKRLRAMLRTRGAKAVRETTFYQGKTRRWGVAWSFVATDDSAAATQTRGGAAPACAPRSRRSRARGRRRVRARGEGRVRRGGVRGGEGGGGEEKGVGASVRDRVAAARASGPLRCGRGGASSGGARGGGVRRRRPGARAGVAGGQRAVLGREGDERRRAESLRRRAREGRGARAEALRVTPRGRRGDSNFESVLAYKKRTV